ncbi:hypothetical protein GGR53DRAFT_504390 [Hypoxylon sp. FL1150]|nr:hypothetical protein GGR53DRAFT_504390 [Hypoxylon sp. FL1150]
MCCLVKYIMGTYIYMRDVTLSSNMEAPQFSGHADPNWSRSPSAQHPRRAITPYNKDGTTVFLHPMINPRRDANNPGRNSGSGPGKVRSRKPSNPSNAPARGTTSSRITSIASKTGISELVDAQLKVSLAAKQLAIQISESKGFWIMFRGKFEEQVKEIKYYAGEDIIQQLWVKKIQHDSRFRTDESQKHQQFSFPLMGLEACIGQVNDAAAALTEYLGKTPSKHDYRQLALDKIRTAGKLVLELAERSTKSSAACADLVMEACNLEKLVDPKSPEAHIIHHFDQREAKPTHGDEAGMGPNSGEQNTMEEQGSSDETVIVHPTTDHNLTDSYL